MISSARSGVTSPPVRPVLATSATSASTETNIGRRRSAICTMPVREPSPASMRARREAAKVLFVVRRFQRASASGCSSASTETGGRLRKEEVFADAVGGDALQTRDRYPMDRRKDRHLVVVDPEEDLRRLNGRVLLPERQARSTPGPVDRVLLRERHVGLLLDVLADGVGPKEETVRRPEDVAPGGDRRVGGDHRLQDVRIAGLTVDDRVTRTLRQGARAFPSS